MTNYHHHDAISDLDREMKETESKKERDRELLLEYTHIIITRYTYSMYLPCTEIKFINNNNALYQPKEKTNNISY